MPPPCAPSCKRTAIRQENGYKVHEITIAWSPKGAQTKIRSCLATDIASKLLDAARETWRVPCKGDLYKGKESAWSYSGWAAVNPLRNDDPCPRP